MNWLELSCGVVLQAILVIIIGQSLTLFHYAYSRQMMLLKESMEVTHALDILTRSITQAGFPAQNIKETSDHETTLNSSAKNKSKTARLATADESLLAIEIGKLKQLRQGQFVFPKMSSTIKTDALIVRHGSRGHMDCLGHVIDSSRLKNGLAYQGFFLQEQRYQTGPIRFLEFKQQGRPKKSMGALMCQSIDRQGRFQNDALLLGVANFELHKATQSEKSNPIRQQEEIFIRLEMQSGKSYSKFVTMKHPERF